MKYLAIRDSFSTRPHSQTALTNCWYRCSISSGGGTDPAKFMRVQSSQNSPSNRNGRYSKLCRASTTRPYSWSASFDTVYSGCQPGNRSILVFQKPNELRGKRDRDRFLWDSLAHYRAISSLLERCRSSLLRRKLLSSKSCERQI